MTGNNTSLCPACGESTSGNFCHHCGTALGGRFCNQCGADLSGGGRFCNQCGAPAEARAAGSPAAAGGGTGGTGAASGSRAPKGPSGGASRQKADAANAGQSNNLPWWFAGAAMFILIMVVGWNMVQPGPPPAPGGGTMPAGTADPNGPGTTDISQMSPREAADRLFDRIMRSVSLGDTVQAQGFLPMAIQAYNLARPLDADGLFHLALLQTTGGQFDAAIATAGEILAIEPNNLLGLGTAAQAAAQLGRQDEAMGYYRRFEENFQTESARTVPEYQGHTSYLQGARSEAEAFLRGS